MFLAPTFFALHAGAAACFVFSPAPSLRSGAALNDAIIAAARRGSQSGFRSAQQRRRLTLLAMASSDDDGGGWFSLSDDTSPGAVKTRILEEGSGETAAKGAEVSIDYVGTLLPSGGGLPSWTPTDVVKCWLLAQQGVPEGLADQILSEGVDGKALTDGSFTDDFVKETLGVENRMQCKKLTVAARRLAKQVEEYADEFEFDSSRERGPFSFVLGKGKAIRAMEMAAGTMKKGKAEVICRADYAYGNEGLRRANEDIVVPPFATLKFDITLLEC